MVILVGQHITESKCFDDFIIRDAVKKKTDYLVTSIKRVGRYHGEITIS